MVRGSADPSPPWLPPLRLLWPGARPSAEELHAFARDASDHAKRCSYPGSVDSLPEERLWFVNRADRRIGRGRRDYERASEALGSLECLELTWLAHCAHADSLAICSRQFGCVWLMNANRIISRENDRSNGGRRRSITWATTQRHVLCGEERVSVVWDAATDDVRFQVLSFSRPRHLYSWAAYPYVLAQQRRFARDAAEAMRAKVGDA